MAVNGTVHQSFRDLESNPIQEVQEMTPSTLPTRSQSTLQTIQLTQSVPTTEGFLSLDNNPSPSALSSMHFGSVAPNVRRWQLMEDSVRWSGSENGGPKGNGACRLVPTVQPLQTNVMGNQLQDCGTGKSGFRLRIYQLKSEAATTENEGSRTPNISSGECNDLRTTCGVAPRTFGHFDPASSPPSDPRQVLRTERNAECGDQGWETNNAIVLPQQLSRMPDEENLYQGSWEHDWGVENAVLLSQQPQRTSVEENRLQGPEEQNWGMNNAVSIYNQIPWWSNGMMSSSLPISQQPLGITQQTEPFW